MEHMTVKELIAELQKCDPEGIVYIDIVDDTDDFNYVRATTYPCEVKQLSNGVKTSVIISGDLEDWYGE